MCARIVPECDLMDSRSERIKAVITYYEEIYDSMKLKIATQYPQEDLRSSGKVTHDEIEVCKSIVLKAKSDKELQDWVEAKENRIILYKLVDEIIEMSKKTGRDIHLVNPMDALRALKGKSNSGKEMVEWHDDH